MAPATIIGTNKLASIAGTSVAAVSYARRVAIAWTVAAPAAFSALIFSFFGAYTVTKVSPDFFRTVLPIVLLAVAIYTFARKDFGSVHTPLHTGRKEQTLALLIGSGIGFYDGFFGPGTGSFLTLTLVALGGLGLVRAIGNTKFLNLATNIAGSCISPPPPTTASTKPALNAATPNTAYSTMTCLSQRANATLYGRN
jgi:uncharacterized membrane protein YfcA